ncbi:MAG: hypothetical protein M3P83_04425 [Actinomycetota bacterium]|nr:hypothetical protein [Actinomycetota bacterium]
MGRFRDELFGDKDARARAKDERLAARADHESARDSKLEDKRAKQEAKARATASKKGIDVDGALVVAHTLNEDGAPETLVVWPDRIELHNHGKVGSLFGKGKGVGP